MPEAIKVLASAWSIAFILLFIGAATGTLPTSPDAIAVRSHLILGLFAGAVTGAGWLWHRHKTKARSRDGAMELIERLD